MTHRLARLAGILIVLATAVHPAAAQSPDVKTDRRPPRRRGKKTS